MQVLILEPSKFYADMLGNILHAQQALVTITASSSGALETLRERAMDLILVDRYLDNGTADEVAKNIRSLKQHRDTPILMLTTEAQLPDPDRYFQAGITDILNKTNLDNIESTLVQFMDNARLYPRGRVLYVEGTKRRATRTKAHLQDINLDVDHFTCADKALNAFLKWEYDLVITDMVLPGEMSAMGLINHIRHLNNDKQHTPILALTKQSDQTRKVEILRLGANDLACMPYAPEEFQARVRNLMRQKQMMDTMVEQKRQLFEMATRDQLTKLYNRHYLMGQAPGIISESRRHGHPICVMVIDLDLFKQINDGNGHATGDLVLKETGALLAKSLRNEDLAARFGGEEFVVILNHCSPRNALQKAETIRAALEQLRPAGITITASIGLTVYHGNEDTSFDTLFRQADLATYRAKAAGRNRVVIHNH